jgi:predicted transcriptional regulator of viral defense system
MKLNDVEISKAREDYVACFLTPKQGAGIRQIARTMNASRSAAVRTIIDLGLRQLLPGYSDEV